MESFPAGYFDGQSSKEFTVHVFIDEPNNRLAIEHADTAIEYWLLQDITVEHTGNLTEIKYSDKPVISLHISNVIFRKELRKILSAKGYAGWYHKLIYAGTAVHIIMAVSILALIAAVYLLVLPFVAEKAVAVLPDSYDQSLGNNFYENFIQYETVDSEKTRLARQFAAQLSFNSARPLRFTVVKSNEENAFALPDGNIIIFSTILDHMDNYTELAALMSHEAAHVNKRHSMKLLCRDLSGYLFLSVVLSDVNGIMAVLANNVHTLRTLSYSRSFEQEADMEGIQTMIKNNIDPHGMAQLFEQLKKSHDSKIPDFISTHPLTTDRIHYINEKISSLPQAWKSNERLAEIFKEIKMKKSRVP